jgi:hypothetical protein
MVLKQIRCGTYPLSPVPCRGKLSTSPKFFVHPFPDQVRLIHPSGFGQALQCLNLLGGQTNPHYGLGAPVEDRLLDFFECIFKVGNVTSVPELRKFLNGIDVRNLTHTYRFER